MRKGRHLLAGLNTGLLAAEEAVIGVKLILKQSWPAQKDEVLSKLNNKIWKKEASNKWVISGLWR